MGESREADIWVNEAGLLVHGPMGSREKQASICQVAPEGAVP